MATRIHRIGNIYSRIDGLIRKGHLKETDKPLWFDVYKAFPPKYEPTFKRRAPEMSVEIILYKEDALRVKIQKAFPEQVRFIHLTSNKELFSERLLKTCQQYILEGLSEEEAIEKLKLSFSESKELEESQTNKANEKEPLDEVL